MTMTSPSEIIEAHDALVEKAIDICRRAPGRSVWGEETYARLGIDGDEASLITPNATTEWDVTVIAQESATFPARLLTAAPEEVDAWIASESAAADRKAAERRRAHEATATAQRRAAYEALKREFGDA